MNDIANISYFGDCFDTTPAGEIPLSNFYSAVRCADYGSEIEKIRSCTDVEEKKKLKKLLPCFTISGTFSQRNAAGLKHHSGRICIDIDADDNTHINDWSELRSTLGTWGSVEFSSLSASGKGVFLVIVIRWPEKHLQHYIALQKTFARYGLTIDPLCKDVCRLRYMSADKGAVLNDSVIPYRIIYEEPAPRKRKSKIDKSDDLRPTIDMIVSKGIDITDGYNAWYQIGAALANEFGEAGRDDFHRLSRIYPKYRERECDKQYNACLKNPKGYSRATIFYYLKQLGISGVGGSTSEDSKRPAPGVASTTSGRDY